MIYVTGCSSPLAMERYKDSFVLSAAKRSRGLEPWQWRTAACRRPKRRQGRLALASYPRSAARQRTFAVQVFVVSLRMKSNHKSSFFWQMDICKFLFFKKLNEPFPVVFCDICKGLLRLLELIDWQESHIITWNTRIFSVQHLIYILSCIPPV